MLDIMIPAKGYTCYMMYGDFGSANYRGRSKSSKLIFVHVFRAQGCGAAQTSIQLRVSHFCKGSRTNINTPSSLVPKGLGTRLYTIKWMTVAIYDMLANTRERLELAEPPRAWPRPSALSLALAYHLHCSHKGINNDFRGWKFCYCQRN